MVQVSDLVVANLYESEDAVIQDALRHLLRSRPDLRLRYALYQYENGGISLGKAASLAGISWAQMLDVLTEQGIQPKLGSDSMEELQQEVDVLRVLLNAAKDDEGIQR